MKLPEAYLINLFTFFADAQPMLAQMSGVEYSPENAVETGIEIAAIGLLFASQEKSQPMTKEVMQEKVWEAYQAWTARIEKTQADDGAACDCGHEHDAPEEKPSLPDENK